MSGIVIKAFELCAEFDKVRSEIESLDVSNDNIDFVKSYLYYALFDDDPTWRDTRLHEQGIAHILYCNTEPVGVVVTQQTTSSGLISIDLLLVSSNHRGRGFGTYLLKYCLMTSKKIKLEVHADNSIAVCMYKKYGFKFTDARGDYIVMTRSADKFKPLLQAT